MQTENLIAVQQFCSSHHLEVSFIQMLQEHGLIEITTIEEKTYLSTSELPHAERLARLHHDLGINIEGIDAIRYLLQRVERMQEEITALKNRLNMYEEE